MAPLYTFLRRIPLVCGSLLFFLSFYSASGQQWRWAQQYQGFGYPTVNLALTRGTSGDSFVYGEFSNSIQLPGITLRSRGMHDGFVAQIDSAGNWQWVLQIGGQGNDRLKALRADTLGNFFLLGSGADSIRVGNSLLPVTDSGDYVVKITAARTVQWAKRLREITDLQADRDGAVYICGSFEDSIQLGPFTLRERFPRDTTTFYFHGPDVYLASLSATGSWRWALSGGGAGEQFNPRIASSGRGEVLLLGEYDSQIPVDTTWFGNHWLEPAYIDNSFFVAKPDPVNRSWHWARALRSMGFAWSLGDAKLDTGGNLYVIGEAGKGLWLNAGSQTDTIISWRVGMLQNFIVKLSANGSLSFGRAIGPPGNVHLWALEMSDDGRFFLSGSGYDTLRVDQVEVPMHSQLLTGAKYFLAMFDNQGSWHWGISTPVVIDKMHPAPGHLTISGGVVDSLLVANQWFVPLPQTALVAQLALPPFIHRFSPTNGPVGTVVTLTGTGFTDATQVLFGGVAATFTVIDDQTIIVTVPLGVSTAAAGVVIQVVTAAGPGQAVTNFYPRPNGLSEEFATDKLQLWPNPAHGTVNLSGVPIGATTVQVVDALGRVVYSSAIRISHLELPLAGLPKGIYTVRAGTAVKRLIID